MTSTSTTPATTTPYYPSAFQIHVYKETFKFNAAHFVAFDGYRERLHGHNYQVSIRLFGGGRTRNKISTSIGHDGYLLDFGIIKSVTKRVCQTLNEHFLCPMYSDVIDIHMIDDNNNEQQQQAVKLTCQDGTVFVFPRNDCILLPIVHATAEEIAVYLYGQILNGLQQEQQEQGSTTTTKTGTTTTLSASDYLRKQRNIHSMEITVAEAPGQEAIFRYDIPEEDTTTTAESSSSYELDVRKFINNNNGGIMPCLKENENKKNKNHQHIDGSPSSSSSSGATATNTTTTTTTTTGRSSIAVGDRGNKGIDGGGVIGGSNNRQQQCCCRCCCNCNNNNCCSSTDNNNFTNTRQLLSRLADAINNDGRFFQQQGQQQQQGEQQRVVTVQDLQDILSSS